MKRDIIDLLESYPREHPELPDEYKKIYIQYYKENRGGKTFVSKLARNFEKWVHTTIAKSAAKEKKTLEIGAGNLNHLDYEKSDIYDIVEPFKELWMDSPKIKYVRNKYSDISELQNEKYDRIISIACFEHVEDLPKMIRLTQSLLNDKGKLITTIPNEGRFLWTISWRLTTGLEFRRRYKLDYGVIMRHEHINTADEIECILKFYYKEVKQKLFGVGKGFSMFRYYECSNPIIHE